MTSTTGRAPITVRARFASPRFLLQACAVSLLAIGAALFARDYLGGDDSPAYASVNANHRQELEANIQFFETRVRETKDHLSYDRLTTLYLQRLRESGDVSDVSRAEASALASLDANDEAYTGTLNLALVRIAQHRFPEAASLAQKARDAKQMAPDAYAVLGDAQMALGLYEEATKNYAKYLELAPGFSAFARQANLAEVRGNIPLATQYWELAIDVSRLESPADSAWARVQLGNHTFLTGSLKEARREYETALDIYPGLASAEAGLARVEAAAGNEAKAIALYGSLVARIPLPEYVIAYGEVLERSGRKGEAQGQFALVNAIDQLYVSHGVKNDLAVLTFRLDHGASSEMPAALESARAAYADRQSTSGADTLAWALYRNGKFEEARAKSDEALMWGTQDPSLLFHRGMIAHALGDGAGALRFLREAMALNPTFSVVNSPVAEATLKSLEAKR